MPFQTVFQPDTFQTAPLAFQIDKPREDEDKDKDGGTAKLGVKPSEGTAQAEE